MPGKKPPPEVGWYEFFDILLPLLPPAEADPDLASCDDEPVPDAGPDSGD